MGRKKPGVLIPLYYSNNPAGAAYFSAAQSSVPPYPVTKKRRNELLRIQGAMVVSGGRRGPKLVVEHERRNPDRKGKLEYSFSADKGKAKRAPPKVAEGSLTGGVKR